ncbi:peptide-methionine (R)-S-oxide reductase MsrB [Pararhizobium mangrovi]|uniref:peptide-methionine (R)-S-oxide reductase n=1 Tax=Pararhizobium mangrovi TaxID=2590452 RepID=A0A506TXV4_9HYPH|nr:peptide-methionine (R)-S-oxide reductase MsrB [Pararhizobium mangrovi]TPW25791.1 peptide-methionine (R)-S-oxide reductase MsrB [Pararhizobium mangrovi]
MLDRRTFLSGAAIAAIGGSFFVRGGARAADQKFPYQLSTAEWRKKLTPEQFRVLREEGTEAPFSSDLLHEARTGIFHCAGCDNAVYSSKTKFDSGTGWPSFYQAMNGGVGTKSDHKLFAERTEVHCARCGGHLGHIFDDGPKPTGKRHCIDGVALNFKPKASA